jgi:hypothetical protein
MTHEQVVKISRSTFRKPGVTFAPTTTVKANVLKRQKLRGATGVSRQLLQRRKVKSNEEVVEVESCRHLISAWTHSNTKECGLRTECTRFSQAGLTVSLAWAAPDCPRCRYRLWRGQDNRLSSIWRAGCSGRSVAPGIGEGAYSIRPQSRDAWVASRLG